MGSWIEDFQELVCKIYEVWGGNCEDLDWGGDGQAVVDTLNAVSSGGVQLPQFSDQNERERYEDMITKLGTILDSPNNTLSPGVTAGFQAFQAAQEDALAQSGS